jgi:hypothetical protein
MLRRTRGHAGRIVCRALPLQKGDCRRLSTAAPIVPLSFDLHLPASKQQYSSSQKIPAVVLTHGVLQALHNLVNNFLAVWLKDQSAHPFKTPGPINSDTSIHPRSAQSRRDNQKWHRRPLIRINGRRRGNLSSRAGTG